MASKNWLKIDTSVLDGDVWSKKYSKVEAYIYLVKSARWQKNEEEKFGIKFGTGQLVTSFRELSAVWGWKYSSVRRFCDSLKSQGIIEIFDCGRASCITITNMKCETTVEHKWLTSGSPNESLNGSPKTQNNNELNNVCESLNGSLNGSQVNHPSDSSHAQVILNLFDNNVDNNKQDNIEVDKENKEENIYAKFEQFRLKYKSYGGKVRGFQTELDDFKKKHKDWKEVIPCLEYAIDKENEARMKADAQKIFFARIQNLKTYLNQRSWEAYSEGWEDYDPDAYHPDGLPYDEEFDAYRFYPCNPNYDLNDGYTADNRPDGARIVEQINVYVWSKDKRLWIRQ